MQKAAEEADHEIDGGDLSELTFLAFKAGYLAAKRHWRGFAQQQPRNSKGN